MDTPEGGVPIAAADGLQQALGPLFECELRDDGVLRVVTPLMDDSNDLIEVFVRRTGGVWEAGDFGESLGFLRLTGFDADEIDRAGVEREARGTGVALDRGELLLRGGAALPLDRAVLSVAIAAMRVTHMRPRSFADTGERGGEAPPKSIGELAREQGAAFRPPPDYGALADGLWPTEEEAEAFRREIRPARYRGGRLAAARRAFAAPLRALRRFAPGR